MANDILLNVKSGDVKLDDNQKNLVFYDVIWGDMFEKDSGMNLYANIVIPYKNRNIIVNSDGTEYNLLIHASYRSEDRNVFFRFVTKVNGEYELLSDTYSTIPESIPCYHYNDLEIVRTKASQFPNINLSGYYKINIFSLSESEFYRAIIYSANNADFSIGQSDDVSAQLLSLCGPGKNYRYPFAGVDVTRYINSVISHTDLGVRLLDEFGKDSKSVSDADFDSTSGVLKTMFTGSEETDDSIQLQPIDTLDIELFKVADDDYIRDVVNSMRAMSEGSDFITDVFNAREIYGIYCVGNKTGMNIPFEITNHKRLDFNGVLVNDPDYCVMTAKLSFGSVIEFGVSDSEFSDCSPLFVVKEGQFVAYEFPVGDNNIFDRIGKYMIVTSSNCTLMYSLKNNISGQPERMVRCYNSSIYKDLLVIAVDGVYGNGTGKLYGIVSNNTNIREAMVDMETGRIIIITK